MRRSKAGGAVRSWGALLGSLMLIACAASRPGVAQRAALLVERGREAEAASLLRAHIAEHPPAIPERRLLIRTLAASGNLKAAQMEVERLRRHVGQQSPLPWIELGHAYELSHEYEMALAMYDKAATIAPRDPAGPLAGGMRAARWGEAELAEPRLVEALRRDTRLADAWHALGLVRMKLGRPDEARSAYRSGLQADPQALENRLGLATVALALNEPAAALEQYDLLLLERPNFADAHLGRSWALIGLGRLDEAAQALDEGYRLGANPRVVRAQRKLLRKKRALREGEPNRAQPAAP